MTTKRRRSLARSFGGGGTYYNRASKTKPWIVDESRSGGRNYSGTQYTESEGHPWPPPKGKFKGDIGGDFLTIKSWVEYINSSPSQVMSGDELKKFFGHIQCPIPFLINGTVTFPTSGWSSDEELIEKGTVAIAECEPTNPVSDSATLLGEVLKDGIPIPGIRLWQQRTKLYLGIAEEFLNGVFGWLPLVEDTKKVAKAIRDANAVLEQYKRDEGRQVRREFHFPPEREESDKVMAENVRAVLGKGNFNQPDFNNDPRGTLIRHRVTERKCWFSGAFVYHIPDDNDNFISMMDAGTQADKLLGAKLTPETLWELTPWSWAVDWFSNTQQVIHNLQAIELYGLVMRYGYIMETSVIRDTYTLIGGTGYRNGNKLVPPSACAPVTVVTERKRRLKANPFGFGVTWDGLSPLQLAIASALGITRAFK